MALTIDQFKTETAPTSSISNSPKIFFYVMASGGLYSLIYINNSQS